MNEDVVARLRARLMELGAIQVKESRDGASSIETYDVASVHVSLESDYGAWRANLGFDGGALMPASFWMAALDGSRTVPVPAVTDEDLPRLVALIPALLAQAPSLAPVVSAMGQDEAGAAVVTQLRLRRLPDTRRWLGTRRHYEVASFRDGADTPEWTRETQHPHRLLRREGMHPTDIYDCVANAEDAWDGGVGEWASAFP
jgi:hypothetical protein